MPAFEATPSGGVRLQLDAAETDIIRRLIGELRALLLATDGDPVTERLLPNAYEDEREQAAYTELVGDMLLREKLEVLDRISTSLGSGSSDLTLDGEDLDAWLASLTDMRLAIGTRLDVDEEMMAKQIDPSDPDASALAVLHWLGWIQQEILEAVGA